MLLLPVRREEDVVVREHHALRRTGRTRGVHEAAALVHRHLGLPLTQPGIQLTPLVGRSEGDDLPPTEDAGVRRLSSVLDDLLQRRDFVDDLK